MDIINFFGLKLTDFTIQEIEEFNLTTLRNNESKIVFGWGFAQIPLIRKFPNLLNDTNFADLLLCDGTIFYRFVKMMRYKISVRLSIPEYVNLIISTTYKESLSIYLLGATAEINKLAINNLTKQYPNIRIDGHHGFFEGTEESKIIENIKLNDYSLILIGISSPKKERIARKLKENKIARLIVPCGGMIDILSGKTTQTPKIIKRLGFAMIYRIIQEPKRLLWPRILLTIEVFGYIIPLTIWHRFITKAENFNFGEIWKKD